jgi:nitrite reductase/ring-hydroxylating ferredoxin subunit
MNRVNAHLHSDVGARHHTSRNFYVRIVRAGYLGHTLSNTTDHILHTLAEYPGTDDAACLALPPEAYTDRGLYELEVETIFQREWLLIGRANDIANAGDWFTFQILDDPLLVVRGMDGVIRVLSNICRHRYMPVALAEQGNANRFVCSYHRWTYDTTGKLIAAPLMEGSLAFQRVRLRAPGVSRRNLARFHVRQPRLARGATHPDTTRS